MHNGAEWVKAAVLSKHSVAAPNPVTDDGFVFWKGRLLATRAQDPVSGEVYIFNRPNKQ